MADGMNWIDWGGGECPVGYDTLVDCWLRGESSPCKDPQEARAWYWRHDGDAFDIIKYRIVREATQ